MPRVAFETVLVADRGAVAVRLLEAYRELGVKVVAVHSSDEDGPEHVRVADEAVLLGDESGYADPARVVEAAQQSRAQAVDPGSGPLARDPDAAQVVRDAGLTWVEPRQTVPEGAELLALLQGERS